MLLESTVAVPPGIAIFAVTLLVAIWYYVSWSRLRHVPGPFLWSISNLPRARLAWSGKMHEAHIEQHRKYGKLVRLGPNCVSVGDPTEMPKIYGTGANMIKVGKGVNNCDGRE